MLSKQDLIDWHKSVSNKGWMGYNWPKEYGGTGWSPAQIYIFQNELGLAGCPPFIPFGVSMVWPGLFIHSVTKNKNKDFFQIFLILILGGVRVTLRLDLVQI